MTRRLIFLMALAVAVYGQTQHVVLISIDGGAAFHLDNPNLEIPTIRRLIATGAWADQGSETVFPSVTHPSHTTLITGVYPQKHGVLANDLVRGAAGDLVPGNTLPRSEIILSKTIFDTAKQKGLTTAAFMWPETVEDKAIDYNFINRSQPGKSTRTMVRNSFTAELEKDGVPVALMDRGPDGTWDGLGDAITAMAACDAIRKHKPNLIAIHLVETDSAQHKDGPASEVAHAEFARVDHYIAHILTALKDAGIYDQTTVIVGADHGFATILHEVNIRPYFAEAGLEGKIRFYPGRWAPFLRLLPNFDPKTDQPKLDAALARVAGNLHVLRIYRSAEFPAALHLPRFEDSDRVRGQVLVVGDFDTLLVWTEDKDTSWRKVAKPEHGHGYLPFRSEMYPMLVMSGSGIRKGVKVGHVRNVDVAPTISQLLGLPALDFDGAVIREALEK